MIILKPTAGTSVRKESRRIEIFSYSQASPDSVSNMTIMRIMWTFVYTFTQATINGRTLENFGAVYHMSKATCKC